MELSAPQDHEDMVASLCSFSGQEEDVVRATLGEADWDFEKASLQLYEVCRRSGLHASASVCHPGSICRAYLA